MREFLIYNVNHYCMAFNQFLVTKVNFSKMLFLPDNYFMDKDAVNGGVKMRRVAHQSVTPRPLCIYGLFGEGLPFFGALLVEYLERHVINKVAQNNFA